ncbi:aquaporin-7 isoform X2 [Acipenser ruthenus]|uniref:aquaporin-7 isoform X2 n=1 Tax=Acipenser ruthenus TaxID=7906 RepID=UPI0027420EA9|nr:aquaporin-7 isoform X2 [Acipenser ruthenus]
MKLDKQFVSNVKKAIRIQNEYLREALAEILSTFVMMVFGLGSVAQVVMGGGSYGDYFSINLGFGLGVTMGIHIAGGVSDALFEFCGGNFTVTGPRATAGIFATYPAPYLSVGGGFLDQVLGTAMLLLCILALNDHRNSPALSGTQPVLIGLLVVVIGISLGSNSGYAINPARDLPPRFFTSMAGWGPDVFSAGNGWWWIPVVAPMVGSVTGSLLYKLFIEYHHPSEMHLEEGLGGVCSDQKHCFRF